MYLFTLSPGVYVFGKSPKSECPSANYRIEPSADLKTVTIVQVQNGVAEYKDRLVTSFQKANGEFYADFAELEAGYTGFFRNDTTQSAQPLPSGAATSAKQTDGSQKTQVVDAAFVDSITRYKTAKLTVTLPNNQNAYAAGDVVLGISAAVLEWLNVAKAAGYGIDIVGARIQVTDPTGLANKTFRLHVFNNTIAPIADNAAFSISDVNTDKREGNFLVQMGTGTMSKVGSNYAENIIMNPVGTSVYLILETVEGFTPSAVSTVINIYLKYIQGN